MRFSIIVPVFNAEQFVGACLDSVFAQTYGDFEVICVDDGSTDGSREVLEDRSFGEARMHVIQKANGGPSSARNDGIRVAQGDFVLFLDADDQLEPGALERIARAFDDKPCDAVAFGWSYHPAACADRFVRERADVRDAYYAAFEPALLFEEMSNPYLRVAVRREALRESDVLFDESLRIGEDAQFLFALYPRIGGVSLVSDKLYRYRLPHPGSIMADYRDNVADLCVCDLNTAIAIFADWRRAGLLASYGAQLVHWFVRGQLYTILRQPPEVREPLTSLTRQMLRANFAVSDLMALDMRDSEKELLRIVLAADDEGRLVVDEGTLSRALFAWRVDEYGIADLALTALERTGERLLANRRMLLKSELPGASKPAGDEDARIGAAASAGVDGGADGRAHDCDGKDRGSGQDPWQQGRGERLESEAPTWSGFGSPEGGKRDGLLDAVGDIGLADVCPIVSVIVPIYNVERYLDQALESVQRQTLRALEILCINDGSTDSSCDIVRKHAEDDVRIKLIDKPNGGYGSACNRGIEEARGTWLAILEPDDWIEEGMYASMVEFANAFDGPVDVVKTPYWRIWLPDTERQRRVNCSYRGRIKPASQPFKLTDPGVTHLIIHHPSIWSALYRREFIERCGIRFQEIPGAGWADNPFLAETLSQAESIVYLDEPFYHYREETPEKTADVARKSWKVSIDRWHDMLDVYERLGVQDDTIRRAHIRRGFTYVGLILEYHDLDTESEVRDAVLSVFQRMDGELVFSEPNISPGSKRLYADLLGMEAPKLSALPYAVQVVKGGLYNIVNTGPAMTLDTFRSFIGSHAKRDGKG